MTEFKVIDSLMGSGKTSWIIERMNDADFTDKFIYITPYLDEIDRIKAAVEGRAIKTPGNNNTEGRKLTSLKYLIEGGYDVVSTHSLLRTADDELIKLIKENGYHLIIDEAMEVIEEVNVNKRDIDRLRENKEIEVADNGLVSWIGDDDSDSWFTDIYYLTKAKTLYLIRDRMLVKIFSESVLKSFESVTVMTYLFDYTQMAFWFALNEIEYTKQAVKYNHDLCNYELVKYDIYEENREELYSLMGIHEGRYNTQLERIRFTSTGLNAITKQPNYDEEFDRIERVIRNFLDANKDGKKKGYWTILKKVKDYMSPRGYTKNHVSLNLRATNDYAEAPALIYLSDRYLNPMQKGFFADRGVVCNEEGWALSEILQFIYRSRIRKGEKVALLIPPRRMRTLLKKWSRYEL